MSVSCIYEGTIRHRRFAVRGNEFSHRIALGYFDLDELSGLLGGRLVARRFGALRFRRGDYLGDPTVPLADAVRDTVLALTGSRPTGPIRVLTHPRILGHCFNPVSFYYCINPADGRPDVVLAEVTNTPWGERHNYVLRFDRSSNVLAAEFDKRLHVSPFMGMDYRYSARLTAPGDTLSVHIESHAEERIDFDATLALRRRELTRRNARRMALRYPLGTVRVLALIYGHGLALRLWGVPVHAHPARESA